MKSVTSQKNILRQVTKSENFVEQRRFSRLDVSLKAQCLVVGKKEAREVFLKNISSGGCLLKVSEKMDQKKRIQFKIILCHNKCLNVFGQIVRIACNKDGIFEYGVVFDTLDRHQRNEFSKFCFETMYAMVGLNNWPTSPTYKEVVG